MSRAERRVLPPAPRLGSAVREAAGDLYYNSMRFLGANLIWGAALLSVVYVASLSLLGSLLLLLMVPLTAGVMTMAVRLVRAGHVGFSDFTEGVRRPLLRNLGVGAVQLFLIAVLVVDVLVGIGTGNLAGFVLAVAAFYGLVGLWVFAVVAWPILLDPERHDEPLRAKLRVAALLVLAHPLRLGGLAFTIGILLVVSTLALAALVTFALSFALLIAARYVLPAADRLEGRLTRVIEDE